MNEVWARLALVGGALGVALVVTFVLRAQASGVARTIESTGLNSGTYLFTSSACPDCGSARRVLDETMGSSRYVEMSWESEPGIFDELGVKAVPATLVVESDGSGVLWPGQPDKAMKALGP